MPRWCIRHCLPLNLRLGASSFRKACISYQVGNFPKITLWLHQSEDRYEMYMRELRHDYHFLDRKGAWEMAKKRFQQTSLEKLQPLKQKQPVPANLWILFNSSCIWVKAFELVWLLIRIPPHVAWWLPTNHLRGIHPHSARSPHCSLLRCTPQEICTSCAFGGQVLCSTAAVTWR